MIITEKEKSKVVFSSLLPSHYPKLYDDLSKILWAYYGGFGTVTNTKDYWVRDFMPIQLKENLFVKYIYNPDYLQDKKKYITDVDKVINRCPFVMDCEFINIPLVIDGGNMVFCKGRRNIIDTEYVVMTEKMLAENPSFSRQQIETILKAAFQNPDLTLVWLPWDKEDTFGHTDGIVRYVGISESGKPKVLVNLEVYDDAIANRMYDILTQHFEVVEIKLSEYDELSWAYINSLQTQEFIIVPGIGNSLTDEEAMSQYKELFPQYKDNIYMVQMRDFIAENGGALNCLTWTLYEDFTRALLSGKYIEKIGSDDCKRLPVQKSIDDVLKDMPPF